MCITGHKVYNGQHQNVFGHHLEKKDGSGQRVEKEKKLESKPMESKDTVYRLVSYIKCLES
jgi:hypothetical protein